MILQQVTTVINYCAIENEEMSNIISCIVMLSIISIFLLSLLLTFPLFFVKRAARRKYFPWSHSWTSTICQRRETNTENNLDRDNG